MPCPHLWKADKTSTQHPSNLTLEYVTRNKKLIPDSCSDKIDDETKCMNDRGNKSLNCSNKPQYNNESQVYLKLKNSWIIKNER